MGVLNTLSTVPLISLGLIVWVVGVGCGNNQTAPPKSLASEQVAPTIERTAAARSMMTVLGRLQIAAANGNKVAEEMLKQYRASK